MSDEPIYCGLSLFLGEEEGEISLRTVDGLVPGERQVRRLKELRATLADEAAAGPDPAYYMYNSVLRFSAADAGRTYHWRYDLTVLPPGRYGDEYLRTAGHYHPIVEGTDLAYPEVYEVVQGSALFILQRVDNYRAGPADVRVEDVILLHAKAGEQALLPPGYGHWTINVTDAPLVISNWICAEFESHYESVVECRGPCCYVTVGPHGPRLERNGRYRRVPEILRHARPQASPDLGLVAPESIYFDLQYAPRKWAYLCDPRQAEADLTSAMRIISTHPFPR